MITPLEQMIGSDDFKEILRTDATTEEGEYIVAEYFGVDTRWECLLEQWEKGKPKCYWFQAILRALISCQIKK